MSGTPMDIGSLAAELERARKAYEDAKQSESRASSESTACLNRLNEVQKKIDACIAEFRKHAPRESDWERQNRARTPC